MATTKVWLVTGASSGLGATIAVSALRAGHKVVACARNPDEAAKSYPDITSLGGEWLQLDVSAATTQKAVSGAVERMGRIDVVVNNAGYCLVGSLEDLSDDEIHSQMDTNFFGAIRVIKGVLPTMRAQKSGTIVNMSGVFGLSPAPACGIYNSSKFALEGLSETLALDLAPFGIRVVIIEPGVFRTNVFAACHVPKGGISQPYQDSLVGGVVGAFGYVAQNPEVTQHGDANKLGDRVVEFVNGTGMAEGLEKFLRLPLGMDCIARVRHSLKTMGENYDALEKIAASTDHDGTSSQGATGAMSVPVWSHHSATPA